MLAQYRMDGEGTQSILGRNECFRCGAPRLTDASRFLCERCHDEDCHFFVPGWTLTPEQATLARVVGLPPGSTPWGAAGDPGSFGIDEQWPGYELVSFGRVVDNIPPTEPWRYLIGSRDDGHTVVQVHTWLQRAYYTGIPAWIEVRWRHGTGEYGEQIYGIEHLPVCVTETDAALHHFARVRPLLAAAWNAPRGRRRGPSTNPVDVANDTRIAMLARQRVADGWDFKKVARTVGHMSPQALRKLSARDDKRHGRDS